jgi:cob(I)alamin adenosyltransferase
MRKGLVIVNTGNGKGKTTAALGMLLRAWGHDMKVGVVQFLKSDGAPYGEIKAAKKLGLDWSITGDGCTWTVKDLDHSADLARQGWTLAQEKIVSGQYDVLLLDEFTYPLHFGWLNTGEVLDWLRQNKPAELHLVLTGRNASQDLIDYADLVTEMHLVKHPYESQSLPGQRGVEF